MPYKSHDERLAYQRKYYAEKKQGYTSNPGRLKACKAGMDARAEIIKTSYSKYLSPSDVKAVCSAHAKLNNADLDKTMVFCLRTLDGAMDDGVFIGSVLFGSARSRSEREIRKLEKFKRLVKTKAFKHCPESLVLQLEIEEKNHGCESTCYVWRCASDDYRHHRWLEKR